ncbi:MAG TPA: secondary thiamine-phosphate synthase enzyme YjbQ [Hyphomonadaceae bacterium]|nr:secondary thiamine-phosphate synthase enzyme YjbQ [Hyphomonadaceae bacterium]
MKAILTVSTTGPGLYEFTRAAEEFLAKARAGDGLLTLLVQHTSCSIVIQENADADVRRDLDAFFRRLAPPADDPSMRWITHRTEGPDDMPAHIKAALLPTSLSIPVMEGRMALGTWQGLYLFEHRDAPHTRRVAVHFS